MRSPTEIIRGVRQTEKGSRLSGRGQYLLDVVLDSNKVEIRRAVEKLFKVNVKKVNTQTTHGKWKRLQQRRGRQPDRKKAIVTIQKGQKIEVEAKTQT